MLEGDHAVLNDVDLVELVLEESVALLDFVPVHKFEGVWIWVLQFLGLLFADVSNVKRLNGIDTNWDEFLPRDFLIFVFICKGYQHVDIIIVEAIRKCSKGVSEFLVGQFAATVFIHVLEHLAKGSFESADEPW